MKKNLCVIAGVILLIFVASSVSFAQEKIGFINVREILNSSNAGKKASDDLKKIRDKRQTEIDVMEKELQTMKDDLEKKAAILTATARRDLETAYQRKMRDYQLLVSDAQEELKKRDQETFEKLMPEIWKVVSSIAEKENYTLILDIATLPVPYFDKKKDLSKRVIDEFNKVSATRR